jgi:RNA polymerase sigma factor (sigma-70 family)
VNARLFAELRPVGFAVAYRMLGSVSEAEDVVQEAFLCLHHTLQDGERIESPRAYLSTVVTRLCIDHLRSARARRETYVEALPEPLVGEAGTAVALVRAGGPAGVADTGDPASHAETAAAAAAEQIEGQQARQREHDPQRVGTGAGEPQVDAVLAGGQVQLDQAIARPADGHRGVVHRGRPAAR